MQRIVFKREFFVLFGAVKTEIVQYWKKRYNPLKRLLSKKSSNKNHLKFGTTFGTEVTLRTREREMPGSNPGRACRPSRSEFSVVFSETRVNTG